MSPNHNVGYDLKEFSNFFDTTILLTRKNKKDHFKSFVNLYYKEIILKKGEHSEYSYDDIPSELKTKLKSNENWFSILNGIETIRQLSSSMNNPILYYEDLYYNDGVNYIKSKIPNININSFKAALSNTKKLRKSNIEKTII